MKNRVKEVQDLGTLVLAGALARDYAECQDLAESIVNKYEFERTISMKLRHFAIGLRQLADAVDEQAVLVAEALAEIECAKPGKGD